MRLLTINEVQSMQLELMKKLHCYLSEKEIKYYLIAGSALGAVRHNGFIPWDDDIDIGMFRDDYEQFISSCSDFSDDYDIVNFHNAKNCDFCLTRIYFPNTYLDVEFARKTKLDKRLYMDIFPLDNVSDNEYDRNVFEKRINSKKQWIYKVDVRDNDNTRFLLFIKKIISLVLSPFRQALLKNLDGYLKKYSNSNTCLVCSLLSQYSFKKQAMPKSFYGEPTLHIFEDAEFYVPEQIDNYLTNLYGENYMAVPPENKRRVGHNIYIVDQE